MQRASNILLIAGFLMALSGCGSDDENGGNAGAGAGGMAGGTGGTTGGAGGAAGTMSGGTGGATGGVGGTAGTMSGGAGGMTGGMGGATGGMGGATGGMGGATGGMGGATGGMGGTDAGVDSGGGDSATFTEVYDIIEASCGGGTFGCHVMGTSGGLDMQSQAMAFNELVGVASEECDGETRVIAGDADNSLIIKALEGSVECIEQMPRGRTPLSEDDIATIRAWIDDGAMNN